MRNKTNPYSLMHREQLLLYKQKHEYDLSILNQNDIYSERVQLKRQNLLNKLNDINHSLGIIKVRRIHDEELMLKFLSRELKDYTIATHILKDMSKNLVFRTSVLPIQIEENSSEEPTTKGKNYIKKILIDFIFIIKLLLNVLKINHLLKYLLKATTEKTYCQY